MLEKSEKLMPVISFAIFTCLLLPVRILFTTFVSNNWLGSFGILSVFVFVMFYLTKNKKLGWFGKIILYQFKWLQKGKKPIIVMVESSFVVSVLAGFIIMIIFSPVLFHDTYQYMMNESKNVKYFQSINMTKIGNIDDAGKAINTVEDAFKGHSIFDVLQVNFDLFVYHFDRFSSMMTVLNNFSSGYYLHFMTVFFVESVEEFGVFLFYRKFMWEKS